MSWIVFGWLCLWLPLTEKVVFKTMFQSGNRVQVPRPVRWRFKMGSNQVLRVTVFASDSFRLGRESFYGQMGKDGRITVPKIQRELLEAGLEKRLDHQVIEVTLEPV